MNRFLTSVCALLFAVGGVYAQSTQVKNAAKSAFKLIGYDANGTEISSTCGVFVSADGEAIGSWSALSTAANAVVTDFNGKTYPVQKLIGANEIYDVCHFKVGAQKVQAATLAKSILPKDSKVWLVGSESKKPTATEYEIEREEKFMDQYAYYVLAFRDSQGIPGSPVVNSKGEVVGLFQSAPSAVDARFAANLKFDALTINNPLYANSGIRMQLPSEKKDAQLMVMFAADKGDSAKYAGYIADYISQLLYSKAEYQKAYELFEELTKSSISNSEVFFEAAQCKTQLGASNEEIIVLLDSAVARCPQPYTTVSAPYILTRGQLRDAMKNYRGALADYNTYDTIMVGRASADFYYTRYKCEVNLRQYQQALNDIAHAAFVAHPDMRPVYLAEFASLQLRVNRFEDAIRTADLCLSVDNSSTDALVIKGVALNAIKRKAESAECFKKAAELGDKRGDEYLKKYSLK